MTPRCKLLWWLLAAFLFGMLWARGADVIPAGRRTTWEGNVGVPGGIPNRTTIYATLGQGATTAQIQAALNACPSNQVVRLSGSAYNLSGLGIPQGVTLRGNGMDSTVLTMSGAIHLGSQTWYSDPLGFWPVGAFRNSWTGGLTQGSTDITVANASQYTVGRLILLDQNNDGNQGPGNCGTLSGCWTSVNSPNTGIDRYQNQTAKILAINGSTITISEPIYMTNWGAARSPQAWSWPTAYLTEKAGVEDLTINALASGAQPVNMDQAYGCWLKGVKIILGYSYGSGNGGGSCIEMMLLVRCEFRRCWLQGVDQAGLDQYGFYVRQGSGLLFEDNIAAGIAVPFLIQGMDGGVIAYNYAIDTPHPGSSGGYVGYSIMWHGGHPNMNLVEGNYFNQFCSDYCWGSAAYNTAFRNRFTGFSPAHRGGNEQPAQIAYMQRYINIAGNVLGTTGTHNTYEQSSGTVTPCPGPGTDTDRVYYIGQVHAGCPSGEGYDATAYSTLLRACNWDSANGAIVQNGFAPGDLPDSMFLSGKPSYFGNLTWPPVDVASPAYSGSITNIPAGYRYVYGVDPPSSDNPAIGVSPASYDFGTVASGSSVTNTFTVQNTSGGSLVGTASVPVGPFSIVGTNGYTLTNLQTSTIKVKYTPTTAGGDARTVTFTGGGGTTREVTGQMLVYMTWPTWWTCTPGAEILAPMVTNINNYISQPTITGGDPDPIATGGQANYWFYVTNAGDYVFNFEILTADAGRNSIFWNVDAIPTNEYCIDDFVVSTTWTNDLGSWLGNGGTNGSDFDPKVVTLAEGAHQLRIVGREMETQIRRITIQSYAPETNPPVPPHISIQPLPVVTTNGSTVAFRVTATGDPVLLYQWQKGGTNIASATESVYTITNTVATNAGTYRVIVTNDTASVTSVAVTLTVYVPVSMATQPQSQTRNENQSATFYVVASGNPSPSYQWTFNGTNVAAATTSSLSRTANAATAGSYAVVVGNLVGSITSTDAVLTVNLKPYAITNNLTGLGHTVTQYEGFTYFCIAGGHTPLTYTWWRDGSGLSPEITTNYYIRELSEFDAGRYRVSVANSVGTTYFPTNYPGGDLLTVLLIPEIYDHPQSLSLTQGNNATFTVTAVGTPPLHYWWQKDGSTVEGAAASVYSITNVTTNDAGSYTVVVSNTALTITSDVATLSVAGPEAPPEPAAAPASPYRVRMFMLP